MWKWLKSILGINEEVEDPMKYLIVGLGNMDPEYDHTRHNIGFDVVDKLAKDAEVSWKNDTLGDIAEYKHKGRTIILLKPSTYMNRSGKAVNYWVQKKKIQRNNLLIVVDDIHLDFGKLRMRAKGSDAGHNGLKDIQKYVGGVQYPRLRVGIGNDFHSGQQVDYVLGKWTAEEEAELPEILKKAADAVNSFASIGLKFTMEKFNG